MAQKDNENYNIYNTNNITQDTLHCLLLLISKKDCEVRKLKKENDCVFKNMNYSKKK